MPAPRPKYRPEQVPTVWAAPHHQRARCTTCSADLVADHPLRLEGVCSTACLKADAPRRARYQDPNWRP